MRQIIFNLDASDKTLIFNNFVVQGENLATELVFNLSPEFQGYKYLIIFQNNSRTPVVSPELTAVDNVVKYTITNAVTSQAGILKIQFQAYDDNDKLVKSVVTNLPIKESIEGDAEIMPEDMVPWYLEAVKQAGIATEEASKLASYNAVMNERIDNLVSGLTQEGEVIDARNSAVKSKTFDSLRARLEEVEQDIELKADKLKVATIEKEINDFQKTLSQVNINQEAKQSVTGYGVVSLPKNAANGQVSVSVKGQSVNQIIKNGNFENGSTDWILVDSTWTIANGVAIFDGTDTGRLIQNINLIANNKYAFIFDVLDDIRLGIFNSSGTTEYLSHADYSIGKQCVIFTPTTTDGIRLTARITKGSGKISNIMLIDLTSEGLESLTTEQIKQRYPIYIKAGTKSTICAGRITAKNEDETEQSQLYYVAKDPETGEIIEARSLPNGTKDEIRVSEGKLIKRVSGDVIINGSMVDIFYTLSSGYQYVRTKAMSNAFGFSGALNGETVLYNQNNLIVQQIPYADRLNEGVDGTYYTTDDFKIQILFAPNTFVTTQSAIDYFNNNPHTLTYQLAEPVEIPIEVSGTLMSYPSGTIYVENVIADAGIYTDKFTILQQDLPIKEIEKISKVDFTTGIETELDVSQAVIATDKLSFTHPDLVNGDIVFTTYFYDVESTQGETTVTYYDSRHTVKDKTLENKFYQWTIEVDNGTPSIKLVEV